MIDSRKWAQVAIDKLKAGQQVGIRPHGSSMYPRIVSGQLCTIDPIQAIESILIGDIVLCEVRGSQYLHFVKDIRDGLYQIGNNKGGVNGWIGPSDIFGKFIGIAK